MKTIGILDYSMGNIASVKAAFDHLGANTFLISSIDDYAPCDLLVLPGVGAFKDAINIIREKKFDLLIKQHTETGKYFLGICLGMQMLANNSEENGLHSGLGLIPGTVVKIPKTSQEGETHKVPHVGWSEVFPHDLNSKNIPLSLSNQSFYFVHSYYFNTSSEDNDFADCNYGGHKICAMVKHKNILGVQFHPEKSGPAGLKFLEEILMLD